jgi:hypothetical protein
MPSRASVCVKVILNPPLLGSLCNIATSLNPTFVVCMYVAVHVAVATAGLVFPAKRPSRHLMGHHARKFGNSCATHQYGQPSRFPHCW